MISGGCGRFFEGTAEQMEHALCNVIAGLSNNTLVSWGQEDVGGVHLLD
tara:strand:+ start:1322 stop:1468 length:147 start_codon:yes stop_codon:yes gene_type:complete